MEDNKKIKESKRPDFFFKPAEEIRNLLKIQEKEYKEAYSIKNIKYHKDYFLYGILDEVEKAGVAMIRYEEMLQGDRISTEDRMSRNVLSSIRDEQSLWIRKLTECLALLINFKNTNQNEYFRHFLLIKEYEDLGKKIFDLKEYFACESKILMDNKLWIKEDINEIESQKNFDISKCWYLKSIKNRKIATKNKIIESAIKNTKSKGEKLALGVSYYNSYGNTSNDIHAGTGNIDLALSTDKLRSAMGFMGVLSSNIMVQCRKLLRLKRKGWTHTLVKILKKTDIENGGFEKKFAPNIQKGDFVLVDGDLGEVCEVNKSIYGYKSFQVKFYKDGIWTRVRDFFPASRIKLFYNKKNIAKGVYEKVCEGKSWKNKPNMRKINNSVREAVKDMWFNCGFKEFNNGRPDLGKLKIEKKLAEMKKDIKNNIFQQLTQKLSEFIKSKNIEPEHMLRTGFWIREIWSQADEEMQIAAICHDIERLFPLREGEVKPPKSLNDEDNEEYLLWHGKRSAEFAEKLLREYGFNDEQKLERIKTLIAEHSFGGTKERDLMRDADSLSFFERPEKFIEKWKDADREDLRERFNSEFNRISSPKAKEFSKPLYEKVIEKIK